jgi:RimJ/RimL family protein N-acetyltransferase
MPDDREEAMNRTAMTDDAIRAVTLRDGRRLAVRAISPADVDALRAMHRRLSPTSVSRRFFAAMPELGEQQAAYFCAADGADRAALVAVDDDGNLLAVARYDRLPDSVDAEVAVVVQDDYQHQHVGTALLRLLTEQARAGGIRRFVADVQADNGRMFATFREAGLRGETSFDHGIAHLVLPLAGDLHADVVGADT